MPPAAPAATEQERAPALPPRGVGCRVGLPRAGAVAGVGLAALALALGGQSFLTSGRVSDSGLAAATACYGLAAVVLVLGWRGSYQNVSLLRIPQAALTTIPVRRVDAVRPAVSGGGTLRLGGALLALSTNILAVRVLRDDWASPAGFWLWAGSLAALGLTVLGERGAPVPPAAAPEALGGPDNRRVLRLGEAGLVLALLGLALALRLWRLGDLAPGMHGDEGEAGVEALNILSGQAAPPFATGWFNQANVYFWSIALGMKLFGSGLGGLRAFAVACGLLTVLFVYLCAREMFGQRAALIAGVLVACGSADLFFSRHEFSAAAVPPLIALACYGVLRGLRTTRPAPFVLAGFAAGLAVYYQATGWLVPATLAVFLGYLLLTRRDFLGVYGSRLAAFGLAVILVAAPGWAYAADHPVPAGAHPNGGFIWGQYDLLARQYGAAGWPGILWGQLTRTLALITYRADGSTLGALDYAPFVPLQAALIVLGLAWAIWRWRDTRFALLLCWVGVPVLIGGVPAASAPNLPRVVAALPALALVTAAVLDHLAEAIPAAVRGLARGREWGGAGRGLAAAVVTGTLAIVGLQQGQLYFGYYLNSRTSADVTGQAAAVQRAGSAAYYYDLGAPLIFWNHGDNRFINPTAQGRDMLNASDDLPILDNGPNADQDAVFLVWNGMRDYLWALYAYYPNGIDGTVPLSDTTHATPPLLTYTVSHAEIDRYRVIRARYQPASGAPVERAEGSIGLGGAAPPPAGLVYPVAATWDGGLVAPAYQTYGFQIRAPPGTRLTIDDLDVLTVPLSASGPTTAHVVLARGAHTIHLAATLADTSTPVDLAWTGAGGVPRHIARRYLWDNHIGRGWLGTIRPLDPSDPLGEADAGSPGGRAAGTDYSRRIDGFLGFRDTSRLVPSARPFTGVWTATLDVPEAGQYGFALTSQGGSRLSVDGQTVVDNPAAGGAAPTADGNIGLGAGRHTITVRYSWQSGDGVLDVRWTPPGQPAQPLLTPAARPPAGGAWPPDELGP